MGNWVVNIHPSCGQDFNLDKASLRPKMCDRNSGTFHKTTDMNPLRVSSFAKPDAPPLSLAFMVLEGSLPPQKGSHQPSYKPCDLQW